MTSVRYADGRHDPQRAVVSPGTATIPAMAFIEASGLVKTYHGTASAGWITRELQTVFDIGEDLTPGVRGASRVAVTVGFELFPDPISRTGLGAFSLSYRGRDMSRCDDAPR